MSLNFFINPINLCCGDGIRSSTQRVQHRIDTILNKACEFAERLP